MTHHTPLAQPARKAGCVHRQLDRQHDDAHGTDRQSRTGHQSFRNQDQSSRRPTFPPAAEASRIPRRLELPSVATQVKLSKLFLSAPLVPEQPGKPIGKIPPAASSRSRMFLRCAAAPLTSHPSHRNSRSTNRAEQIGTVLLYGWPVPSLNCRKEFRGTSAHDSRRPLGQRIETLGIRAASPNPNSSRSSPQER